MNIIQTFHSIHYHPRYFGSDAEVWRPARWIQASGTDTPTTGSTIFDRETVWSPPRGSFLPWAEGDRACPGKKFAHVELVGALTALFGSGWRIEPVKEGETESIQDARKRVQSMINDSGMTLLIEMLHPETVGLKWVKKEAMSKS